MKWSFFFVFVFWLFNSTPITEWVLKYRVKHLWLIGSPVVVCLAGSRAVGDGWETLHFKSEAIRAYLKYQKSQSVLEKLFFLKNFRLHVCKRWSCHGSVCTQEASLWFPYNQLFLSSIKLRWGCPLDFLSQPQPYHISAEFAPNLLTFVALGNSSNHRGWKEKE